MHIKHYIHSFHFHTESGTILPQLEIAYHTYGQLNAKKNNVIWVCHALTANSDVADWWKAIVGDNKVIDPKKHFIVCANILASCYGSSGPISINPETGKAYHSTFPFITIRDMVQAHILLRKHLGIDTIKLCLGGSMGGYQVLEWVLTEPKVFDNIFVIATTAAETAWGIAIHTAQRLAIEADSSWQDANATAGAKGLKAARAIGMLTYRNYKAFVSTQSNETDRLGDYKAESYILYQGDKLVKRFHAQSYHLLTKAMDSHQLGRGRTSAAKALSTIQTRTLIIGISTDQLCPTDEQHFLAKWIPNSEFHEISSEYGHDGFLIEGEKVSEILKKFMD
jgi:homoserine O-acetyltransferase